VCFWAARALISAVGAFRDARGTSHEARYGVRLGASLTASTLAASPAAATTGCQSAVVRPGSVMSSPESAWPAVAPAGAAKLVPANARSVWLVAR
jgi:hypothetical protein